ncbi:MAG: glycoside hydrolase family 15 protein [Gemmataceae bacterium]|nr:glycoside hydrolase family 15 protein [Gemmataceae bacterium]
MPYQPIESYGVVGNMQTAALVGLNGSVDWLCLPRFDSPSVFGAILDDQKGGFFRITPAAEGARHKQYYWPETNVLVTRFLHPDGIAEVEDYMPVGPGASPDDWLVRRVRVVRGKLPVRLECRPAFDYARAKHEVRVNEHGARFDGPGLSLGLVSSVPLSRDGGGAVGEFTRNEGEAAAFVLRTIDPDAQPGRCPGTGEAEDRFRETVAYWQRWVGKCTYHGRWRETVLRSALALKLLTYEPTGAIVAAPTTSLPEGVGGVRSWDYRYTWVRDAAFTVYGFMRLGLMEEAARFREWMTERAKEATKGPNGPIGLMYAVDGSPVPDEVELPHLDGYRGSKPVRVGNGARDQLQLDVYGALLDAAYLFNKYGAPVTADGWGRLRRLVDWVADNWDRPDEGVWETRGGRKDHVYSRFMCWVALDRGLRLADKRSFPAPRDKWLAARDAAYEQVLAKGWSEERQAFVQSYGSDNLDAAMLLMPLTFFMAPNDPRMLATIDAITTPATKGGLAADGLVYRYDFKATHDGLEGYEGTFNMCSFWLVEALTRAGRTDPARLADARLRFEQMLGYGNPLGLYAEQTGPSGEALGNFPQAFTHLALISAAFNLDRVLGGRA